MACVALVGAVAGRFVREGSGQEIWLEGDEEGKDGGSGVDGGRRRGGD
jgi:hypothetical protein